MATQSKSANLDLSGLIESAASQFRGLNPNQPGQWPWLPKAAAWARTCAAKTSSSKSTRYRLCSLPGVYKSAV